MMTILKLMDNNGFNFTVSEAKYTYQSASVVSIVTNWFCLHNDKGKESSSVMSEFQNQILLHDLKNVE